MHIQSLLVPAILAIGVSAGASRWCEQWSNVDNQVMKCYWTACGKDYNDIGYKHPDGSKKVSTTRYHSADWQCNAQGLFTEKYANLPNSDCCDAFGFNQYLAGCVFGWSDLWCYRTK